MTSDKPEPADPASSPCFAADLDAEGKAYLGIEEPSPQDVPQWRRAERERLIALRLAVPVAERTRVAAEVAKALDRVIAHGPDRLISLYWPFRGELDLRGWMQSAHERGSRIALPVVVAKGAPLIFREWSPGCAMTRGVWNIPIPAEGAEVIPDTVISPLVGHDPARYRLGYGGGFFDRTLAALPKPAQVIGVGHPCAAIPTIHPQPHDIPMDIILTGLTPPG